MLGSAGSVAPEADALAALQSASSFVWLGLGRILSYESPQVRDTHTHTHMHTQVYRGAHSTAHGHVA